MPDRRHRTDHHDDVSLPDGWAPAPPGRATLTSRHVARAAASSGAPLPAALRDRFESSLGADLGGVRVHTGEASATAADALGARAYAIGNDIHFAGGQYDPQSDRGQWLIAHEVAHTVQQANGGATVQHKLETSQPGDAAEVDADRAATAMVAGTPTTVGASAPMIARAADGEAPASEESGGEEKKEDEDTHFPKWKDDKLSWTLPEALGGGGITLDCKTPSGELSLGGNASMDKKFGTSGEARLGPAAIEMPIEGKVAFVASGAVAINGSWHQAPGPRTDESDKMITIGVSGSGKVGPQIEGSVGLGAILGGKPLGVAAGQKVALTADANMGATISGQGDRFPGGEWDGRIMVEVKGEAVLKGERTFAIEYVLDGDRHTLYESTIGEHTFGKLSITCTAGVDLATGAAIESDPVIVAEWYGWPKAPQKPKRQLSPMEKETLFGNDGGSGGPAEREDEDQLVDVDCNDGAGGGSADCPQKPVSAPDTYDGTGGAGGRSRSTDEEGGSGSASDAAPDGGY